jgi:hypothetical protein
MDGATLWRLWLKGAEMMAAAADAQSVCSTCKLHSIADGCLCDHGAGAWVDDPVGKAKDAGYIRT